MRRFPPPWKVEALDGGFKVVDGNKQAVAYIYGNADPRDAAIAMGLTLDEARRIAANIAKLPDLLGKVRPDDNIQAVGNLSDERHEAEDTTPKGEPWRATSPSCQAYSAKGIEASALVLALFTCSRMQPVG